jgi:branched-chain amino acid transport system ATP-binding protein
MDHAISSPLLKIVDLHAYYGKSHVLNGVNLNIVSGEIVCLLGRNGVGRSTTAKAIMGLVHRTGTIEFKQKSILPLKTYEIAQEGIGYVPEDRAIFGDLTVKQNLILGQKTSQEGQWHIKDIYRLFPILENRQHIAAGLLSGGEQQLLTLSRTLMGNPSLIIIDEPTEGLAPKIVAQVGEFLLELKHKGVTILLIEQKLSIALNISDKVHVMGHGKVVFEGTPIELKENHAIQQEWLEI